MAQTPGKTATTKKLASPPKALSTTKKIAVAKPNAAASKALSKPSGKQSTKAVQVDAKGNGDIPKRKKASKSASVTGAVTPEQRYRMICETAYYRAEQRGFIGGSAEQDWREAEIEVDQMLCAVQVQQQNH